MSSLADLFQSVIVPRSVGSRWRASAMIARYGWRFWRDRALGIADQERREDTLAIFAPTFMVTLLAYWVLSQAVGYGLVFWALARRLAARARRASPRSTSPARRCSRSGTATSYRCTGTRACCRSLAAGGGLATFAVVATFVFQTFGAFQKREAFVVTISERTGAPPSGLEFVMRHLTLDLVSDISPILRESQQWIAEVMETHLAYPVLTYFRSSHDDESWVGTLGALLDASTLLITTLDLNNRGQAELTLHIGTHLVRDFSNFFRLPIGDEGGVEYDEFVTAYRQLRELGAPLRPLEDAWPAFAAKRASYAVPLNAMARWWRIPPAHWIGDRSRVRVHVNVGVPR